MLERWRGATSHRDVPNDPNINDRPAARAMPLEAPMLQPSMDFVPGSLLAPEKAAALAEPAQHGPPSRAGGRLAIDT